MEGDVLLIKEVILIGGFCTAVFAIWRLASKIAQLGADKAITDRRIDDLEKSMEAVNEDRKAELAGAKEWRREVYGAVKEIRELLHGMKQQMIADHAALSERLTRLEATGCDPARKD